MTLWAEKLTNMDKIWKINLLSNRYPKLLLIKRDKETSTSTTHIVIIPLGKMEGIRILAKRLSKLER
jgi:hypothetical protein